MKRIIVSIALMGALCGNAFANKEVGNGGDPNEAIFKEIAANIQGWIISGNANQMRLPSTLSAEQYKASMLGALGAFHVSFTPEPVSVVGAEKTCINYSEGASNQILCNSAAFSQVLKNSIEDTYRLVHHEFAGLAGLEVNRGQDSDYSISSQIGAYLRSEMVKRLPVAKILFSSREESVASCNMAGIKTIMAARIADALEGAYAMSNQAFDRGSVVVKAGKPVSYCVSQELDMSLAAHGCKEWGRVETLDVQFRSPSGTPLRMVTASYSYDDSFPEDLKSGMRDRGLGLGFKVEKKHDADGNLTGRVCHVTAGFEVMGAELLDHSQILVLNPKTGARSDVDKDLARAMPGTIPARSPLQLMEITAKLK